MQNFLDFSNLNQWVSTLGYVGILIVIFAETGCFLGFFFPGDSLVFVAGLLASQGLFSIELLIPSIILVAFLGYVVGYWFGKKLGTYLLAKPDGRFLQTTVFISNPRVFTKNMAPVH